MCTMVVALQVLVYAKFIIHGAVCRIISVTIAISLVRQNTIAITHQNTTLQGSIAPI